MVKNAFETTRDGLEMISLGMPARGTGRIDEVASKNRATAPVLRLLPSMVIKIL